MTDSDIQTKLAELKRQYARDCFALRLGLYGKPRLLIQRLAERGDQYDADVQRVTDQAQSTFDELEGRP